MPPLRRRPVGPPRGPKVTKFAKILWKDCPDPCADVIHIKKITANSSNLQVGMAVTVAWSKDTIKLGEIVLLGKYFCFLFLSLILVELIL